MNLTVHIPSLIIFPKFSNGFVHSILDFQTKTSLSLCELGILFLARVGLHIIMTQAILDQDKCLWSRRIDSNYRGHYINGFTDRLLRPSRTRLDIFYMAGDEGYAPSLQVSKTSVLLLYESPIIIIAYKINAKLPRYKVFESYIIKIYRRSNIKIKYLY